MAEQSLKDKTIKGVGWSSAEAFLGFGVTFLVGLVLARLLSPEEYGLIGIVTIFTTVMLNIVDSGFSNSLIRKQHISDDDYCTLFYSNLAISILMYAILYGSAPLIASFFERSELVQLVRVMGLLLIIQALSIVQNTILTKQIDFKTKTKVSFISAVISGIIGITMALMDFGVWSLVGQQLTRQISFSLCLWLFNRWRPKLRFDMENLKYMWSFGWKLLVSGLIDKIWAELKKVVVSKYYSPSMLGQYSRSGEYANLFSKNLTSVIQRVTYPVLSQMQGDKKRMVSGYRRIIKTTMFITATSMFFLGAISDPLIYCLIGPKWHIAATFLPFICIYRSMYPLQAINLNMLQVQGRTDVFLYLEVVKKIILLIPLWIGAFIGIYWMLVASIGTSIISFFLNSFYTGKSLGYTSWMQLKDVAPSYGVAIAVALSVFFLKYLPLSNWIILPMQIAFGVVFLFLLCEAIKLPEYLEVKGIFIQYLSKNHLKK